MLVADLRRCLPCARCTVFALVLSSAPLLSHADQVTAGRPAPYGGLGVSVGSTGIGADYRFGLGRYLDLRAGYQFGRYQHSIDQGNNRYDGTLKIHAGTLMADLKPFAGGFRISGGFYTGSPALKLKASGLQQYKFGSAVYNGDLKIDGDINLGSSAPYAGIGWGGTTNGRGFGMTADIGVLFTRSPDVSLNATGTACDASTLSSCNPNGLDGFSVTSNDPRALAFQQARVKEIAKIEDDSKNYKYWPVINLGLVYRF